MLPNNCAVVIPAFNEERTIGRVVAKACAVARNVFVVDDGSDDGTHDIARAAGATVLREPHGGFGAALCKGLRFARDQGINDVVTLDGDGAHIPADAPSLFTHHRQTEADLTIGSRFLVANDSIPSPKRAVNRFGRLVINCILGTTLSDVTSGMRVLGPRALALELSSTSFAFTFDLLEKAIAAQLELREWAVGVRYDAEQLFSTSRAELLDFLTYCACCARTEQPLRDALQALIPAIESLRHVRLRCGEETFMIHPAPQIDSFVFQQQHPWFASASPRRPAMPWLHIDIPLCSTTGAAP